MTPLNHKILVAVDLTQKEEYDYQLAEGIDIVMRQDYGFDNKVAKPVLARVVQSAPGYALQPGDAVLCHHNTFVMEQYPGYMLGSLEEKDEYGHSLFVIDPSMIYLKLDTDTQQVQPLPGNLIVERVEKKIDTFLIVPDSAKKTDPNIFRVIQAGPECDSVQNGDIIFCYKHSDIEVHFNYNKKIYKVIRVRYTDVLGIVQDIEAFI
jgi:co-chaperonin GroES (HSP10)